MGAVVVPNLMGPDKLRYVQHRVFLLGREVRPLRTHLRRVGAENRTEGSLPIPTSKTPSCPVVPPVSSSLPRAPVPPSLSSDGSGTASLHALSISMGAGPASSNASAGGRFVQRRKVRPDWPHRCGWFVGSHGRCHYFAVCLAQVPAASRVSTGHFAIASGSMWMCS